MYINLNCTSVLIPSVIFLIASHSVFAKQNESDKELQITQAQYEQEAKAKVMLFAKTLKKTLVKTVQSEGYSAAVNVCNSEAPKIAKALSTDGWSVGRTSLKVRNSGNAPDAWEVGVLNKFDDAYKSGESADSLTSSYLDAEQFRFMKAIPTGQVCLACHGQKIEPALLDSIRSTYPDDKATNFTLQDLRGAFTVSKKIHE